MCRISAIAQRPRGFERVPSVTQISKTAPDAKDEWQTPPWLFDWLDQRFEFGTDLAATAANALLPVFITLEDNAIATDWASLPGPAFCNPPYSNIEPWLRKAREAACDGLTSVFLIPTPNGEEHYGFHVFGAASEVIFITGRLAFINTQGKPQSGNTRGSCIVIYEGHSLGDTRYRHVWRDEIRKEFDE